MKHSTTLLLSALTAVLACASPLRAGVTGTVTLTDRDSGHRLSSMGALAFAPLPQPTEKQQCVFVDPTKTFQSLVGIGGAITDAAAETFFKLPPARRAELLRAYFDPRAGIGYSLVRTNINSCDFSSGSYTYVADGDKDLKTFDIAHDLRYRIPMLREALAAAGRPFPIFVSPWSPPAWMKTNGDMLHGGSLKPEYADAWARYFVKFIDAYQANGVPIWGLTVQNEPMAVQIWESCVYTAAQERDFVKNHLGPVLHAAGLGDKKIIVWDHNRTQMYQRVETILDDPDAAKYVWGVGFHWYVDPCYGNVERVHEAFPATHLMLTEGCNGPFDPKGLDDWKLGETYGTAMIHDFNNGADGWTDWNILLDQHGGPNHVGNFCFAPVHGDTSAGTLHFTNAFYYIGQFSKFIRPGARRIVSSATVDRLLTTAFLNTDGSIAVVVMNPSDQPQPFNLWIHGEAAPVTSPEHSILTVLLRE